MSTPTPKRARKAIFPQPPVCFGLQLVAATASHGLCLEEIETPVLYGARSPTIQDYAAVAYLFSLPAEKAEQVTAAHLRSLDAEPGTLESPLMQGARKVCRDLDLRAVRQQTALLVRHLREIYGMEEPPKKADKKADDKAADAKAPEDGAEPDPSPAGPR